MRRAAHTRSAARVRLVRRVGWIVALGLSGLANRPAASAGDRGYGAYLAGACVTCHRPTGEAVAGVPSIVAWPEEAFVAAMDAFRSGTRRSPVMGTLARGLSDEDIDALAAYFGSLKMEEKAPSRR